MTGVAWAAVWTLIVSIVATGVGSAIAIVVRRRTDRLKAHLDHIDAQLRYFYGPLLATAEASQLAWKVFEATFNPEAAVQKSGFWDPAHPPSPEGRAAYRHWITTLFIPLNDRQVEIITNRADLLVEPGLPQCLTSLCAHSLTLKAVLATWDVTTGGAPNVPHYPSVQLLAYLEDTFARLKREQARLLKAIAAGKGYSLTDTTTPVSLVSDRWRPTGQTSESS